jgi:hypothetical protein
MKQGIPALLTISLITLALVGCEKAAEPANKVERQTERKDQQSVPPPVALWSPEFKDQTLNECIQRATAEANTEGVRRCKCVVEKASTTIPELRFKAVQTDPAVKEQIRQIGATC